MRGLGVIAAAVMMFFVVACNKEEPPKPEYATILSSMDELEAKCVEIEGEIRVFPLRGSIGENMPGTGGPTPSGLFIFSCYKDGNAKYTVLPKLEDVKGVFLEMLKALQEKMKDGAGFKSNETQ